MNFIDVILVFVLLLSAWNGWRNGFVIATLQMVPWLGSLAAGFFLYKYSAAALQKIFTISGVWLYPIAFILAVIITRILMAFVTRHLSRIIPEQTHRNFVNKFLGLIPGIFNGMIYDIIIVALLLSLPLSDAITANAQKSKVVGNFSVGVEWLDEKLAPVFDEAVKRTMNRMMVEPGSNETVKLNFNVRDPKVRSDLESQMLDLVNDERKKAGLPPLKNDAELTIVARKHSADMFARGYFSHYTPEGKDPFVRMKESHVQFLIAGENLAYGHTLLSCHNGLMTSPGHRANILRPQFGRLGIGILDGGIYGLMISQEFRN